MAATTFTMDRGPAAPARGDGVPPAASRRPSPGRAGSVKAASRYLLALVHLYWQTGFYAAAVLLLVGMSFWTTENFQLVPALSPDNYAAFLAKPIYHHALWNSLRYAATASAAATALSLPLAYAIAFAVPARLRPWLLGLVLVPFFSDAVVRMFSWQIWLADHGVVAAWLHGLGFSGDGIGILYTEAASIIGLLSLLVPVGTILIHLSFIRVDRTLLAAAENLGASHRQILWRIVLPYAASGIVTSLLFCFLMAIGDFVAASILGGNKVFYLTTAIEGRLKIDDWPMAATLGVVVLAVSAVAIAVLLRVLMVVPAFMPAVRRGAAR